MNDGHITNFKQKQLQTIMNHQVVSWPGKFHPQAAKPENSELFEAI